MALGRLLGLILMPAFGVTLVWGATSQTERSARDALQPLNELIGSWRGTATPNGTKEEQQRGFWQESIAWEWQFKDKDAWLTVKFEKSKHYLDGILRYDGKKDLFVLTLTTLAKQEQVFSGKLRDKLLTLDTDGADNADVQRIVITLLHDNRFLYRLDAHKAAQRNFSNVFKVGATKEGVAFAGSGVKNECVVSGGQGTMQVTYNGQTYYVCCSGCASEFRADPAKYVKEFEERKAKEAKSGKK
jgi:YHS domain-containing protein